MKRTMSGQLRDGDLAFGTSGPAPVREPVLCALDGRLFELDALRGELRLPPGSSQEQVAAAGWRRWGKGLLHRLRGEFALVVWDSERRAGLVARDELGTRSIFFHAAAGRLTFASEIRDLLGMLASEPGPDREAVAHFLARNVLPPGATLFEGIEQLGPGHLIDIQDGRWRVERWWAPAYTPPQAASRTELAGAFREQVERAVARRLGDDGRTAVIMSGGLDSTALAAMAHRLAPERIGVYSGVFPGRVWVDESDWIERMETGLGLNVVRIEPEPDGLLADAVDHVERWRVPPSGFGFWLRRLYALAAADGSAYAMTGDGGDELCDARPYLIADRLRSGRPLGALRTARSLPLMGDYPPWRPVLSAFLRYGVLAALPYGARRATARFGAAGSGAPDWFSDSARALVGRQWDPEAWKLVDGPRWWADATDRLTRRIQGLGLLDYVRREAERAGIEATLPFFDRDLVELSLAVPPEQLLGPYLRKPVLRAAMAGLMPDSVRLRLLKTHFDEFVIDAVDGAERPRIRELLGSPGAEVLGYVNPARLQAMLDLPAGACGDAPGRARDLWRLASVEYWLRSLSGADLTAFRADRVVHS